MENVKDQLCQGLPHFCSAGMQAPKLAIKPEIEIPAPRRIPTEGNSKQKPWSVFGDVFWI